MEIYARVIAGTERQTEIARDLGVSQSLVSQTADKVNDWLIPQRLGEIKRAKAEHVERLMHLYMEAMRSWEASKQDAVIRKRGISGENMVDMTEERGQVGDPRFIEAARKCLDDIRRIIGANTDVYVHHSGEIRVAGRKPEEVKAEIFERLRSIESN